MGLQSVGSIIKINMNPNKAHQDSLKWHERLAVKITNFVGTMLCAGIFSLLALLMLPTAIQGGVSTFIPWIAQTFLQLVLLSIIMVGQNLQQRHQEIVAEKDYESDLRSERVLHEIRSLLIKYHDKK